jgi:ABC-type dipeptide/oligopeptide/nickel transport system permease component
VRWPRRRASRPRPARSSTSGPSLEYDDWTVNEIVAGALPISVTLGAAAILIALVIGLTAGVVGAVKPNSLADLTTLVVSLIGISLPSFVIGTVLLLVFALLLGWFPVGGSGARRRASCCPPSRSACRSRPTSRASPAWA